MCVSVFVCVCISLVLYFNQLELETEKMFLGSWKDDAATCQLSLCVHLQPDSVTHLFTFLF